MPLSSPSIALVMALLTSPPKVSEAPPIDECDVASPRIELVATPGAIPPVVCVSPRLSITFNFDSPLLPESVRIQDREFFKDVALGQRTLTLVPPDDLVPGRRFEVEVCFADGAAPACATFLILGHPALGMQQVDVFRHRRPVEYFQAVAETAEAEVRQCRADVHQLRAERDVPEGFRGALAADWMRGGIAFKDLTEAIHEQKGGSLSKKSVYSYRSSNRVAVDVWLTNSGTRSWSAAGVALRGPKGEVLKSLPFWSSGPILPDDEIPDKSLRNGHVVVEVLATESEALGTYTLTLWDADKKRIVTLGNVTFP
ncbi:DUF2381 family protein [Vitiosangium sp. GDMCC 1.1324]|uniref:DUF2381 family protein n=1 Tax=Vitiosangium sp. (strain GDMCC 1.1324) TaxID=2138576 RepID=UPI0011B71CC2|nr:DUF2381 family protein [Vitiosangium sp. GDMCC 1.1324]